MFLLFVVPACLSSSCCWSGCRTASPLYKAGLAALQVHNL